MTGRIMVVANKSWEASPLVEALFSKPSIPTFPANQPGRAGKREERRQIAPLARLYDPELGTVAGKDPVPRATFYLSDINADPVADIQVWCLEDWMEPGAGSSNTAEKMRVLAKIFTSSIALFRDFPDAVVAFGTAGIPSAIPFNGGVTVGTRVLVHDPFAARLPEDRLIRRKDGTTEPMWTSSRLDRVLPSTLPGSWFRDIPDELRYSAEARFVAPPIRAATPMTVLAGHGFAALSTVNITDYDDYVWADPQSLATFRKSAHQHEVGSQETTHGLVRIAAEDAFAGPVPFLYVSGITDSVGLFDAEVTPRVGAQNFAAAHNAGVTLAWLLPQLARIP